MRVKHAVAHGLLPFAAVSTDEQGASRGRGPASSTVGESDAQNRGASPGQPRKSTALIRTGRMVTLTRVLALVGGRQVVDLERLGHFTTWMPPRRLNSMYAASSPYRPGGPAERARFRGNVARHRA
jgi:hypothetical protein